ncbi:MAG: GxxExxY protein [Candidatus Hydrogenedentes bacterium]|nr:GxxExxY protein [Candidatus Hydrogenedentota bacterium]
MTQRFAEREIIYKEESYAIMGACFEVYNTKGCGFLESVYQECLAIELESRAIPFVLQPAIELEYKGRRLVQTFRPDFICFGQIILELKALSQLCDENRAQVHNYLHATQYRLGLLVNFGHYPQLEYERIAH